MEEQMFSVHRKLTAKEINREYLAGLTMPATDDAKLTRR